MRERYKWDGTSLHVYYGSGAKVEGGSRQTPRALGCRLANHIAFCSGEDTEFAKFKASRSMIFHPIPYHPVLGKS